jgi:hypothetical protein
MVNLRLVNWSRSRRPDFFGKILTAILARRTLLLSLGTGEILWNCFWLWGLRPFLTAQGYSDILFPGIYCFLTSFMMITWRLSILVRFSCRAYVLWRETKVIISPCKPLLVNCNSISFNSPLRSAPSLLQTLNCFPAYFRLSLSCRRDRGPKVVKSAKELYIKISLEMEVMNWVYRSKLNRIDLNKNKNVWHRDTFILYFTRRKRPNECDCFDLQ